MKALTFGSTMLAALGLAACATAGRDADGVEGPIAGAQPASLSAEIQEPGGRIVARSTATRVGDGVRVSIAAAGLAPGAYGAHVHGTGRCDPPAFESAGPHWNPTQQRHGKDNPAGMHKGDLPNLLVGANGQGDFEFTIPDAALSAEGPLEMIDADGAAIVIHARPDDYRTDPSGNSGARIACGVLR